MSSLRILPELYKVGHFVFGKDKHFLFVLLFPFLWWLQVLLSEPSAVLQGLVQ